MKKAFLAILTVLFPTWCAFGQPIEPGTLAEIESAYRQIEYERAESLSRTALQNYADFTVAELADIHAILALIAYNRGQQEEARRQFLSALHLAPDMQLDPALVPPKIVTYFEDLKAEFESGASFPTEAALRYVMIRDPRLDAALRSMVVPGWGQFYKGQEHRASLYAGLFALTAGGAIFAHFKMRNAHDRYEDASTAPEADRLYGPYNRLYRTRNGLVQGAALVWLASYVDALLTSTPQTEAPGVNVSANGGGVSISVAF